MKNHTDEPSTTRNYNTNQSELRITCQTLKHSFKHLVHTWHVTLEIDIVCRNWLLNLDGCSLKSSLLLALFVCETKNR